MNPTNLLQEASLLQEELISKRRYLHTHPGVGFDLKDTVDFVKKELMQMGYAPKAYGKSGLIAVCGNKEKGKTILLRADMDALAICEEADVEFKSENGKMHACGHDMHTTMLLGAAKLLKQHEDELNGSVVLLFQPSEETLEGALDMIQAGVLEDTKPDAAIMMHIMSGIPFETGSVIVCHGGAGASAADFFDIHIQGKGAHGSAPQNGIDPITIAAHIILALQEIHARELGMTDQAVLTIGKVHSGNASNVIPDTATLGGSLRSFDENLRSMVKRRMEEIVTGVASTFRANATLTFGSGCPALMNDPDLSNAVTGYMKELLGSEKAFNDGELKSKSGGKSPTSIGSEDFAYFSQKIPSLMMVIAGGNSSKGYAYSLHHPKVKFDENVLSIGSAVYAYNAFAWLEEHK